MINGQKPIGGYFSWEFPLQKKTYPYDVGYLVNSAHSALQLLLQNIAVVNKILIPYYICEIVPFSLERIGIKYEFYHINSELEIADEICLSADDYIVYVNYFGIMDSYLATLVKRYGNHLIIDNAQAFFAPSFAECHQIYSPRKFVGVPEGGILITFTEIDIDNIPAAIRNANCSHLLKRTENLVASGFVDFKVNEKKLREENICKMSNITYGILQSLDYDSIIQRRKYNYDCLHRHLSEENGINDTLRSHNSSTFSCPLIYPYYTDDSTLRQRLIENEIFVATYWHNVNDWCNYKDTELSLCNNIIPLPIDQRYNIEDMERVIKVIKGKT